MSDDELDKAVMYDTMPLCPLICADVVKALATIDTVLGGE